MAYPTKIATCCYCGTRAALLLTGEERHELACSSCGAPLHDMKMLKKVRVQDNETLGRHRAVDHRRYDAQKYERFKPKKRRKGLLAKFAEEAFDILEDIFD